MLTVKIYKPTYNCSFERCASGKADDIGLVRPRNYILKAVSNYHNEVLTEQFHNRHMSRYMLQKKAGCTFVFQNKIPNTF